MFLSDSEIDKLFPPADYPDIKRKAHEDRAFIARFREKILVPLSTDFPELFGDNILIKGRPISSIDNYAWAFTMAKSRLWGPGTFSSLGDGNEPSAIPYLDDNEIHMLVPVGELMNFGPGGGCAECEGTYAVRGKSDPDEMHFVCTVKCPIKKGEEVHFWYNDDCKQGAHYRRRGWKRKYLTPPNLPYRPHTLQQILLTRTVSSPLGWMTAVLAK